MRDSRAIAWLHAWRRLQATDTLKTDHRGQVVNPLPELYWALVAEADVLARLAQSDLSVGLEAGGVLEDQERREMEREAAEADVLERLDRFRNAQSPPVETAEPRKRTPAKKTATRRPRVET